MVVEWTPNATEDLAAIWKYYSLKSVRAAAGIVGNIRVAVLSLADFPEMTPVDPLLTRFAAGYRSLVVRRTYKVVYKIENGRVYIMEIFDCRRNPAELRMGVMKDRTTKWK